MERGSWGEGLQPSPLMVISGFWGAEGYGWSGGQAAWCRDMTVWCQGDKDASFAGTHSSPGTFDPL